MSETRTPRLWSVAIYDQERFHAKTISEAVEEYWEATAPRPLPATLDVVGYAPMVPTINDVGDPLNDVLERLDEEYGDPDNGGADLTPAMQEAERVFVAAVLAEYKPWMCEEVCRETVNTADYIAEARRT